MTALATLIIIMMPLGAAALAADVAAHPLDPLTPSEFEIIGRVVAKSGQFSPQTKFAWIELSEPAKTLIARFHPGAALARRASLIAIDYQAGKSFALTVDLGEERLVSVGELKAHQPGLTDRDIAIAREVVSADTRVRQALRQRGLDPDPEKLRVLYLGVDTDPSLSQQTGRLIRAVFVAEQNWINDFGPVFNSLMVVVDVFGRRLVAFYERGPELSAGKAGEDVFDASLRKPPPARPVAALRTAGKSFELQGNVVAWSNWQFRFGFNPREGLVLYQLQFRDGERWRSIAYRASVSEVVSRYTDAGGVWRWMEFFDESTFGLGELAVDVMPGREVPGNAETLDVVMAASGESVIPERRNARIYLYERDRGTLVYYRQRSRLLSARDTELVIGFLTVPGNYAYGLNWVFKQDGSFAFEVELAGQILTTLRLQQPAKGGSAPERSGTIVAPNVLGVSHQHWFNLRIDFDVNGTANAVTETEVRGGPVGRGPTGNAAASRMRLIHRRLARASQAKRDTDENVSRTWTVYNPSVPSGTGEPAGYTIVPMGNALSLFATDRRKGPAAFTFHHLWVTPFREGQLFASGRYPNQAEADYRDTLYYYANGDSISDRDLVVWYSLGETHVPRPEEYPLMASTKLSVLFRPDRFLHTHPALGSMQEVGD